MSRTPDTLRENLQAVLRDTMGIRLGHRQDGLHLLRHTGGSKIHRKRGVKGGTGSTRAQIATGYTGSVRA